MQRNLIILLFDDVELLDFAGPLEVFSIANRWTDPPAFNLVTAAEKPGPIPTKNGLRVLPDLLLGDSPRPEILLVPGGLGTRRELNNPVVVDWIGQQAKSAELVLSVCTGSLLLARAGMLDGAEATTHHVAIDLLRELAPSAAVREDCRFVDNGKVVTSAGIAAGIDMSLHVVRRLLGPDVAAKTASHMEYARTPQE